MKGRKQSKIVRIVEALVANAKLFSSVPERYPCVHCVASACCCEGEGKVKAAKAGSPQPALGNVLSLLPVSDAGEG